MIWHAAMPRRGLSSRRFPVVRSIPRIRFRGHFAGIVLPSVVGEGPPHHALSVGSRVPISGMVRDLAGGTSERAAPSRPRPGEGTSEDRDHPDPVRGQFSASTVEAADWIGRTASGCGEPCRMRHLELRAVAPHPVHHDGEAAGDSHDGALHAASFGDLHAPCLEPAFCLRLVEHHRRRLEQGGAAVSVARGADRAHHVAFAGLLAPGCQSEVWPDILRGPEPGRIVNPGGKLVSGIGRII